MNVTVTPDTGLFPASLTVACSAVANAVLMTVLCGVPAVAVTLPVAGTVSAAALMFTLPSLPLLVTIVHVTRNVWPGRPAR